MNPTASRDWPRGKCRRQLRMRAARTCTMRGAASWEAPSKWMIRASGQMAGLAPMARARRQRSTSSPYMKNAGSKPCKDCQSLLPIIRKQPITMSTSRSSSRPQFGIASGLQNVEPGKRLASPTDMEKTDQRLGRRAQERGSGLPSGRSVRPPQIRASGRRRAKSNSAAIAPGCRSVSGLSSRSNLPLACFAARLLARAKPMLSSSAKRLTCGKFLAMAEALPSVEALSTTMISPSLPSCRKTASIAARVSSRVLKLTMMTESMKVGPQPGRPIAERLTCVESIVFIVTMSLAQEGPHAAA